MKIAALLLADAVTAGGGSLNVLGAFRYIVRVPELPSTRTISVVLIVEAESGEEGAYPVKVEMVEPTGKSEIIGTTIDVAPQVAEDAELPSFNILNAQGQFEFESEGLHRLRARVGRVTAERRFIVRVSGKRKTKDS
jgi:hypothetical protein